MQPLAIGAVDDCCDRGRSRSSRALWRLAARQAAPGAHDGSPTGCDSRAHGVAVTAGGPEFGPPYDRRLLTHARGLAASRLPDGRDGRSVAATLAAPVHRRSSASPRSYVNGIDARTLRRRRRRPRRPPPMPRTHRSRVHCGAIAPGWQRAEVRRRRGALAGPSPTPPSRTRRDRFRSPGSPVTMS